MNWQSWAVADPMLILRKIPGLLNVSFSELHIDNLKVLPVIKDKARVLIVVFVNKRTRDSWLTAKNSRRDIFLLDFLTNASFTKIFINKRSTAIERKFFKDAKQFAAKKMKYPQDFPTAGQLSHASVTTNTVPPLLKNTAQTQSNTARTQSL